MRYSVIEAESFQLQQTLPCFSSSDVIQVSVGGSQGYENSL